MRILCIGAGAIGTYVGGNLAAADQEIYFLVKPSQKVILEGKDLLVYEKSAVKIAKYCRFISDLREIKSSGKIDCVLIAVKSYDTDQVIDSLETISGIFNTILCLQNGVENEEKLLRAFPKSVIIGASVVSAISKLDNGTVRVEKNRGIGLSGNGEVFNQIYDLFIKSGMKPKRFEDLKSMKWSKMISNLFANATSGILDMTPFEIYSRKDLFQIEKKQIIEGLAVMRAENIKVVNLPGLPLKPLVLIIKYLPDLLLQPLLIRLIAKGRGEKMPSFYLDKLKGSTKSEISYLNGAIVKNGKKTGIPTPVNQGLTDIFDEILVNRESSHAYSHNPDLLVKTIFAD